MGNFQFTFFRNGYFAVDYFFLLSGLLMAKHTYSLLNKTDQHTSVSTGEETVIYIWNRIKQLYPYYLPASLIMLGGYILLHRNPVLILGRIPSLFPVMQMTGAFQPEGLIGVAWYLSSMLIAMAIIYPVCKRYYRTYTTLIAPVLGILIAGALIHETGHLANATQWILFSYKGNFRAFAEIGLGTTCYEVSRRIAGYTFNRIQKAAFSVLGTVCYFSAILYFVSPLDKELHGVMLCVHCIALIISFSGIGLLSEKQIFQKRWIMYLGELSLPLYLFQDVARAVVPVMMKKSSGELKAAGILTVTFILSITANVAVVFLKKVLTKRRVLKSRCHKDEKSSSYRGDIDDRCGPD